jgi:excisionase family DNA binding protein
MIQHREPPTKSRRLATLDEAGEYAGCDPRTIRRRIADGSITGYRLGPRSIRVDLNELDAMLRPIPAGHYAG